MQALIIVAHGSRNTHANDNFVKLIEKIMPKLAAHYSIIEIGFLEFASPSLIDAVNAMPTDSSDLTVTVFPYFLHSGNHVVKDIPNLLKSTHLKKAKIKILPALGEHDNMMDLVLQILGNIE